MQNLFLSSQFQAATACRINLPNSYEFQDILSPATLDDIFNDYRMFIEEMRKRVEIFLKKQKEEGKINVATQIGNYGPIRTALEFQGPPETIEKFRDTLDLIFKDLELGDEWKAKGVSWRNLQVNSFENESKKWMLENF